MTAYPELEVRRKLAEFEGWELGDDGQLHKTFTLKDFSRALLFINAVGHLAEAADHHPDILVFSYRNVRISTSTHSEGGITDKDFELIERIEELMA